MSSEDILVRVTRSLNEHLGNNFYSCCVYGSTVRGNALAGVSDINLLIILNQSNPAAHESISRALQGFPQVMPFVLGREGLERSARAFAPKFASIKRNYRVLSGADPLAKLPADTNLDWFLCEQALRNFRLRMSFAFITRKRSDDYGRFLQRSVTPLFIQVSEVLRLNGTPVPKEFEQRIGFIEKEFKIDGQILRDLLAFKARPQKLSEKESVEWHGRLFPVVDAVVRWIEASRS
jgi:hypothetical protein